LKKKLDAIVSEEVTKNAVKRDSLNQHKVDAAYQKTNEMLAKYGYKVDIKNDEIVKILKDPNQRKTTIINSENPLLDIYKMNYEKDSKKLLISLTSFDATSYDIDLKLDILGVIENQMFVLGKNAQITHNEIITKGYKLTRDWTINDIRTSKISKYYLILHGNYKKSDGTVFPIERFYSLDPNKNIEEGYLSPDSNIIKDIKHLTGRNK